MPTETLKEGPSMEGNLPKQLVEDFNKNPNSLSAAELSFIIQFGDEKLARRAGILAADRLGQAVSGINDIYHYMRKNHIIFD